MKLFLLQKFKYKTFWSLRIILKIKLKINKIQNAHYILAGYFCFQEELEDLCLGKTIYWGVCSPFDMFCVTNFSKY